MRRGSSIKSLAAAVSSLEKAARRGPKYCAFCRCVRRVALPGPDASEEEVIHRRCEYCYSEQAIHLPPRGEKAEVLRMYFSYTMEDVYTDPRAHAFGLWLGFMPPMRGSGAALAASLGTNLSDELDRLLERRHEELTAKYGDPFPEHSQLIASVEERERANGGASVFAPGLKELRRKRTDYLICLEFEKIIWGGPKPETEAAVERLSLEMDELVKAYAEAEERRREESRAKNQELINRLREQQGLPPRP